MSGLSSSEESMLMSNGFSVNDMQDIGGSAAFEGKSKMSDVIFIVNFQIVLYNSINYKYIVFISQFIQMEVFTHPRCKATPR